LPNGLSVCNEVGNQSAVDINSDNTTNNIIYTWKDARNGNEDIYIQKLNA
jgi:hypothetical protein